MKTCAEYTTKQRQAIMAMQRASEAAALNGVSDMSSEEINDEIQVVRNGCHNWEEKAGTGFVIEDDRCICVLLSLERYELIMEMLEQKQ